VSNDVRSISRSQESIADDVLVTPTQLGLWRPVVPTLDEMNAALQSLANNKAPGASGLPAEALKALPALMHAAIALPLGPVMLPTAASGPKVLWKNKGSSKRLTNCHGVALQDVFGNSPVPLLLLGCQSC